MSLTKESPELPAISAREARKLASEINRGVAGVRARVLRLHDTRGWRHLRNPETKRPYESWKECVEHEFNFGRQYAYKLLDAAKIDEQVSPEGDTRRVLPETHARVLKEVKPERRREVYEEAVRTAPEGEVTAGHISETIRRMGLRPKHWGSKATDERYVRARAMDRADLAEALDRMQAPKLEAVLRKLIGDVSTRKLERAISEVRYMTSEELTEFNGQEWSL